MAAFLEIKGGTPPITFLEWIEGGLRVSEGWKPGGAIRRIYEIEQPGRDPWGQRA